MTGIRRALVLSTSDRYFTLAASFLTLAIVSRLLTPAEVGVSVLGMAMVALALSLREFAAPNFLIQRKELKLEDVRATFTILALVTSAISILIMVSASGLAIFYEEPGLAPYLRVLSLWILIQIIGILVNALLRREMAFGKLAIINITGATLCTGLTIMFAMLGFSYMSIAWALLLSETAVACLSLLIWTDRSIFKPCLKAWQGAAKFGGYAGTNVLLYRVYESLPYIALGRALPAEGLAFYNRGITICQLPDKLLLGGPMNVLLSAFADEVRNGRSLREPYLRSIEIITGLMWPALILLAILAEPFVRILLGEQWLGSVPIVRIVAIAYLFSFAVELSYPVLVALGAMRDLVLRSLIAWPVSIVVLTCAAFFGLKVAALSWLVTLPFQAYVSVYVVRRHVEVTWHDILSALRKPTALALCSGIGPLSVLILMEGRLELSIVATGCVVALSLIGWGAGLWLTKHPLLQEIEYALNNLLELRTSASNSS